MDIIEKIQNEIKQDYYQRNYPNDGQRFVAWYMRNIHLLDQLQAKDSITDGANDKQIDAVYIDDQSSTMLGKFEDLCKVREIDFSSFQRHNSIH